MKNCSLPSQSRRDFLRLLTSASLTLACGGDYVLATESSNSHVTFLRHGDVDYSKHRQPFNKRITLQPAVIGICFDEEGIQQAVLYAREHGLPIAIKSGGHSFEGFSLNNDGLVIDLSQMNQVDEIQDHRLTVGPGCKVSQMYDFLLPRGRLIPLGSCGGVGVAGLTLGGGYGLFSRKYGLTCDDLIGVRMIDGGGRMHDSEADPDLLWACRGGGNGNFGIISSLRFRTHPIPQHLSSYRFKYRRLDGAKVANLAELWFELGHNLPNHAFSAFVQNGRTVTILVTTTVDSPDVELRRVITALQRKADEMPPVHMDSLAKSVPRYYGRRDPLYFKNVSAGFYRSYDDLRAVAQEAFDQAAQSPGMIFQINTLGGRVSASELEATSAYPHRAFPFLGELQCYWQDPSQEGACVNGLRKIQRLLRENGIHAHYCNYPDIDFRNWARAYYGKENYRRLQSLKKRFDPDDLIRHPQSVRLPRP